MIYKEGNQSGEQKGEENGGEMEAEAHGVAQSLWEPGLWYRAQIPVSGQGQRLEKPS